MGIYAADGSTRITFVSGLAVTGLYAADGSFNVVESLGLTPVGVYHPCGALNVTIAEIPGVWYGYYANDGSVNITRIDQDNGALKVTNVGGALGLLRGETQGFSIDATLSRSTVAIKDTTTPANNLSNVRINGFTFDDTTRAAITGSNLVNSSTAAVNVSWPTTPYVRSAPNNQALQSQTFDNASWSKSTSTVTANAAVAPDGTTTADKLVENNTSAIHTITGAAVVVGRTYNASVYAKSLGESRYLQISGMGIAGVSECPVFNLDAGTVDVGATRTIVKSATITSVGNGWYRCSAVVVPTATSGFEIGLANDTTTNTADTYQGDNASGLYIWGAQLSLGAYLHPYRATTAAAWYGVPVGWDYATNRFGIQCENTLANMLLQSQHLGTTWTNVRSSETTEIALAPDGSVTADKIVEDNTAGDTHLMQQTSTSVTSGTNYTFSVYLKAGERTWARLGGATTRFADNFHADFNLATGVVGTVGSGATGAGIQAIGDGWYRCWVSATCDSTGTNAFLIYIGEGDTDIIYNGDNASGIYVWGAQLESTGIVVAQSPTSYINTGTATATHVAPSIGCATSTYPHSATEGTFVAWVRPLFANSATGDRIIDLNDTTVNETIVMHRLTTDTPDSWACAIDDGGVGQVLSTVTKTGSASVTGNKVAAFYKLNDSGILADGGSEVGDTGCTMPTVTALNIGYASHTAIRVHQGFIYQLVYVPRRMTTAELQTKTT